MRRQIAAALGFMALSSLAIAQQKAPGASPVYTSIRDLMQSIIDPSADVLWNAVGTIVDKENGIVELSPKTEEDWLNMRHAAVRIIEGGNLLLMPGRLAAPAGARSETPGVELALQALGLEALRASEAKNAVLLMDIGARMDGVCESCHQTYWYPHPFTSPSGGR